MINSGHDDHMGLDSGQGQGQGQGQAQHQINDKRTPRDLTAITFSGYKKTDAVKTFMKSLIYSKIEPACYWSAELLCGGHTADIWGVIVQFYCKYVHLGNPKIAIYLEHKYKTFISLKATEYKMSILQMRNDPKVRAMFAEIICVLCDATRKHAFDPIKIGPDDFDLEYMKTRFKAPSMIFAEPIYRRNDPSEFIVAINEFAFHISSSSRNTILACYWVEWIHGFEKRYKDNPTSIETILAPYKCESRDFAAVDAKYRQDIVWLIWDAILYEIETRTAINGGTGTGTIGLLKKTISALLYLYSIGYTKGSYNQRKNIIYFAVNVLCENVSFNCPIVSDINREKCEIVIENIGLIYKQIKLCEQTAGVDYLLDSIA
jgi:hypothetical protein